MNIEDLNSKEIGKDISNNNSVKSVLSNFIKELSNALENNQYKINNTRKFRKNRKIRKRNKRD